MEDWKEKFLELYMEPNFKAALDYKKDHMPSRLYRYRPASGEFYALNEIATGQIYLAHHKELNDPFDASSIMASKSISKYFGEYETAKFKQEFAKYFSQDISRDILEKVLSHENWYEEWLYLAAEKELPADKAQKAGLILNKIVLDEFAKANQAFNDLSYGMLRLACFTTHPYNLPMWANYAETHTGVCLEYDMKSLSEEFICFRFFPVYYTPKLPDALQLLQTMRKKPRIAPFILDYVAIHKLKDWEYEDEWRLIYIVSPQYFGQKDVPKELWDKGKMIQFIKPSRVLLGAKMRPDDEKRAREVCEKCKIPAVKMKITQFGLQEGSDTTQ